MRKSVVVSVLAAALLLTSAAPSYAWSRGWHGHSGVRSGGLRRRRTLVLVGPVLGILPAPVLRLLSAVSHCRGAAGVRPAAASATPGGAATVLVLLCQRKRLLPERSELS